MSAQRYRKKPVVIEAEQFNGENGYVLLDWISQSGQYAAHVASDRVMMIMTLEGEMRVDLDDWVICGVKGEFYPCKPDIFDATYEQVIAVGADPTPTTAESLVAGLPRGPALGSAFLTRERDHADLLRRWDTLTSREQWEIDPGDLHNMLDEAADQIARLRAEPTEAEIAAGANAIASYKGHATLWDSDRKAARVALAAARAVRAGEQ